MATVLGAGSALFTARYLDPFPADAPAPEVADEPPASVEGSLAPAGTPQELALLALVASALACTPAGLTLPQLRIALSEPSGALQQALAVGIRVKQLRRSGARNKVRYLLNF